MHTSQWMGSGPYLARATAHQLRTTKSIDILSAPTNEESYRSWTRWQLIGAIAVIVLFSGDLWYHFASLQWNHLPAIQRQNNGSQPTFFAFHTNPYFVFSEDFHLYCVRAKRIAERGWTDSLLYSRPGEKPCYVAPLQVFLSRLAVLTDGRPIWYGLYMFCVLSLGWSALMIAARCWLPKQVNSASILLAVLLTVLCEAVLYLFVAPDVPTYRIWPELRGLRLSTVAWTSPLLVSVMIGLTNVMVGGRRWPLTVSALTVLLVLLLCADNWAFALAWVATGLTILYLSARIGYCRRKNGIWLRQSIRLVMSLTIVALTTYAIHTTLSRSLLGDVLTRGGVGPAWIGVDQYRDLVPTMGMWCVFAAIPVVAVGLFASIDIMPTEVENSVLLRRRSLGEQVVWRQLWLLALLPLIATPLLYLLLKANGAEPYLRFQLYWRGNYCSVLPFTLIAFEWLRKTLHQFEFRIARRWTLALSLAVAALFAYHDYRVHWYVKYIGRREFFLTVDAEQLRPWLEQFERDHGRFELATCSPELNYLSAYWTNADLLLPTGFPYHNAASDEEIECRALELLRLYNTTRESWLAFSYPTARGFCDLWTESRVAAAGEGFIYHLFHREMTLTMPNQPRFNELERLRIGNLIDEPHKTRGATPEVILIDPVSNALGEPDLSGYTEAFLTDSIQAWVRNDVAARDEDAELTDESGAAG
jgi:hypothetical protein